MSNRYVLDASAVLAKMLEEPGGDRVDAVWIDTVISAVNFAEIVTKLQDRGVADARVDAALAELDASVVDFDEGLAIDAGRLRNATKAAGLSLGDRACLALARQLGATVLTADRAWAGLDLGVTIELIR